MPQRSLHHRACQYDISVLLRLTVQPVADCFDLISVVGGVPDSASMQDAVDSGWKSHTERN